MFRNYTVTYTTKKGEEKTIEMVSTDAAKVVEKVEKFGTIINIESEPIRYTLEDDDYL